MDWAEVVRRYARSLYVHALIALRSREEAEDACQETLLRGMEGLEREPLRDVGAWLHGILRNVVHEILRRRKREVPTGDPPDRPAPDAAEVPPDPFEALGRIPDSYHPVLLLRYGEGRSYREIAQALGISEGSVRGLLHRGMGLLREACRTANGEGAMS